MGQLKVSYGLKGIFLLRMETKTRPKRLLVSETRIMNLVKWGFDLHLLYNFEHGFC